MRFDLWLLGYRKYRVPQAQAELLFAFFEKSLLFPRGLKRCGKRGDLLFFFSLKQAVRFETEATGQGFDFACEKTGGVPLLAKGVYRSPGMLVGMILGLALFLGLCSLVWDVRIVGNESIPTNELESELASCGIFKGRFLFAVDVDGAALSLRESDERVAYAAINRVGTVLYVQIKETKELSAPKPTAPANLVAKADGVVTMPLIFEGECLVQEGDVVRKGQILASGLLDTQNHGYRVTRAAGQVLARTVCTYEVFVPFCYEEKQYTGRVKHEFSLIFFDWVQKVFKNSGNYIDKCDIIEKTEWITLPGGETLPFGYHLIKAAEYVLVPCERSEEQALAIANEELAALLAKECTGRSVLKKRVDISKDALGITLVCSIVYEQDIAEVAEFTLQP